VLENGFAEIQAVNDAGGPLFMTYYRYEIFLGYSIIMG
jgi:hypothetical protein